MMETMIKENGLTFKDIEKKIYRECCRAAQESAREFLEEYDRVLMEKRDRAAYRHKGYRESTVKTVFGEVSYRRAIYEYTDDTGSIRYVYLLDEELKLKRVGLISENCAELLVSGITVKSYRSCAGEISSSTGQTISAMGVWNVVQALGEEICEEERKTVERHRKKKLARGKAVPVLFEETDGVSIRLQGKDRCRSMNGAAEMKVAIAYDGWKAEGKGRYTLNGKVAYAGFAGSSEFHKVREAKIAEAYDLDETSIRILNGDGAQWIKKVPDKDTIFQLDIFHRNKAVRENIPYRKARDDIFSFLGKGETEGLFEYLETYKDSLSDDTEIENAGRLIQYFKTNREGLVPYSMRVDIPDSPKGLEYRGMGTMEGHIWSIIARRMKHNHTAWSRDGANRLAKLLAKKCEGRLHEVTERCRQFVFEEEKADEILGGVLSAASIRTRMGKGYEYPVKGTLPVMNGAIRGDGAKRRSLAGYMTV